MILRHQGSTNSTLDDRTSCNFRPVRARPFVFRSSAKPTRKGINGWQDLGAVEIRLVSEYRAAGRVTGAIGPFVGPATAEGEGDTAGPWWTQGIGANHHIVPTSFRHRSGAEALGETDCDSTTPMHRGKTWENPEILGFDRQDVRVFFPAVVAGQYQPRMTYSKSDDKKDGSGSKSGCSKQDIVRLSDNVRNPKTIHHPSYLVITIKIIPMVEVAIS